MCRCEMSQIQCTCKRFFFKLVLVLGNVEDSVELCKILSELMLIRTTRSLRLPPLVRECTLTPGCAVREQRHRTLSVESELQKSDRFYRIHSSSMFTRVVIFQRPRFVCREFGQRKYISLPMNRQFSKSKNSGKSTFKFLLFCIKIFKKTKSKIFFHNFVLYKKKQQKIDSRALTHDRAVEHLFYFHSFERSLLFKAKILEDAS